MPESPKISKPPLKLKLKFGGNNGNNRAVSPPVREPTPSSALPSSTPKIRLTLNTGSGSKASTPVVESAPVLPTISPEKAKPRMRKPSAKKIAANANGKRDHPDSEDDIQEIVLPPAKKAKPLKLNLKTAQPKVPATPVNAIKFKVKGKIPKRPLGEGYDSEADDKEPDPTIEDQFPLRFDQKLILTSTGFDCSEDCAYIHKMIEDRKIGAGAEVSFKLFDIDGRRALVTVRKNHYAATLVALPTILESMKSFDKKNWMKTVDISQMLLVFAKVQQEDDAKTIELPKIVNRHTQDYPHGLTAPMRYARHRRWKARTRRTDIEEIEEEVNKLFIRDSEVTSTTTDWFDPDIPSRDTSRALFDQEDQDAEVEDYNSPAEGAFYEQYEEEMNDEGEYEGPRLEDELEGAFEVPDFGTPAGEAPTNMNNMNTSSLVQAETSLPTTFSNVTGPASVAAAEATSLAEAESEASPSAEAEGSDDSDDSGDEEDEEEMDEATRAQQASTIELKEDIAELQKKIDDMEANLKESNDIMRKRILQSMANTRSELELKKAGLDALEES